MLQTTFIRNNKTFVIKQLSKRNFGAKEMVDQLIEMDDRRKKTQQQLDDHLASLNQLSKEIGTFYKSGEPEKAEELKTKTVALKEEAHELKEQLGATEKEILDVLYQIPNVPHQAVPEGADEVCNEVLFEKKVDLDLVDSPLPHWELASEFGLIDFDLGAKITGTGFPVYMGKGAKLQRALINFFLDEAMQAGYKEVIPPHLVNETSAIGTGQLPDKEKQMYHTEMDHLYLIPTAEVPITNIYRDVIVQEEHFPIKMVGYTPCFGREAGSYGKDVRGLNRLHQFDKVEIVQITHPDQSYNTLDQMVMYVRGLLDKLELPYRVLRLCAGDLGFTSALTYDLEVFSAAQKKWLEVSSVSNFESFQSNRLKIRFKDSGGKSHLTHTLNGSALALPRILASLLENNQTGNTIQIPSVLQPYTGFETIEL